MKVLYFSLLVMVLAISSCGNKTTETKERNKMESGNTEVVKHEYKLTPVAQSKEFDDAKLERMTYKNGHFGFKYSGKDYQLGAQTTDATLKMCANSAKGQHIHLIIDNQPYLAEYMPKFDLELADGPHTVVAFLSRSYHESIKNGMAYLAKKVIVKNGSFTSEEDIKEPMLVFSRPKGEYAGRSETDRVMLDFFLINAIVGNDYKLRIEINGEQSFAIDRWQPYFLEGLPLGENKIKLTLFDRKGMVEGVNNPVERAFTLRGDVVF